MWSVFTNRHRADHPFRFTDLLSLQTQVLAEIRPAEKSALLFAEVAPTLTLGARQMISEKERARFEMLNLDLVAGERGGNETWHGPGQWVCFVLTPLAEFTGDSRGVRKAVYQILENVRQVAVEYLPEAHLREGPELGLWSNRGKLASVGIKIRDGYVSSGFALNCIQNPLSFSGINPCGIAGSQADFILKNHSHPDLEFSQIPSRIVSVFEKSKI